MVARKPGIVTADSSGSGIAQATIGNDFGALIRTSNVGKIGTFNTRPVYPGERVDFWGTGLGADVASDTGGSSGDLTAAASIRVVLNGVDIVPAFAGRSAGYPGLDEIVIIIPSNVVLDCTVSVQIRAGGVLSNAVTIATATQGANQCTPANNGGGGGGGSSLNPTQSEVNGWISSGAYRAGSVSLARTTSYTTDTAGTAWTTTKNSSFSGSFSRISGADLSNLLQTFAAPSLGQCRVLPSGQVLPYANLVVTTLDAGASLTSVGPPGTQIAAKSVASGQISYDAGTLPYSYVTAGRYSITGPGGANVGSFSTNLDVGTELVWTNWDEAKTITRSSGYTVKWTGGTSGSVVTISGTSFSLTGSFTLFTCLADRAAGQFTIPASILTQIPASPSFSGFGIRGTLVIGIGSNGTRATVSGLDYFTVSDSTTTSVQTLYQ